MLEGEKTMMNKYRIKKAIGRIETIKKECFVKHIPDAIPFLREVEIILQNRNYALTMKKYRLIKNSLSNIRSSVCNSRFYEIKYECERIVDIMADKNLNISKEEESVMKNKQKIIQLQDAIASIDKQIKINNEEMQKCIGKDQISWQKYNAFNKRLKQKRVLYVKQFNSSILFSQNMEICNDAKNIRLEFSDAIAKDFGNVNEDEFVENIDSINFIENEVKEQNNKFSQKLYDSIHEDFDDEYQKACEEKLNEKERMEEDPNSSSSKSIFIYNQ